METKGQVVVFDQGPKALVAIAEMAVAAHRTERAIEICDCILDMMGELFGVPGKELRRKGRGGSNDAMRVRQIAMYVAHVTLRINMRDIGIGFQRDRTTVLHACNTVEDWRDDSDVDRMVGFAERLAAAAFKTRMEQP